MQVLFRALFLVFALALMVGSLAAQKLRVYVLAGQSNMQGHAKVETIDYIGEDPKTAPLLAKMRGKKGKPRVLDNVWVSYLTADGKGNGEGLGKLTTGFGARRSPDQDGGKIGPEFTFGIRVAEAYDGPILLIKTAWGGKSLHTDFRSPSSGPYPFSEQQLERFEKQGKDVAQVRADKAKATGHYYRLMVEHVASVLSDLKRVCPKYNAKKGYELCGFVWFQGWNDMVDRGTYPKRDQPGGYDAYSECMAHFIRDVRKDLNAPKLPFVIGMMGVSGPIKPGQRRAVHQNFRDAMAAPASLAEFQGNVTAVSTDPYWDMRLDEIAARMNRVRNMARMLRTKNKNHPNKDGSMDKRAQQAYVDDYRNKVVGKEGLAVWKRGASNAAYHYLGCAKTMAQIGVAFAEATLAMQ